MDRRPRRQHHPLPPSDGPARDLWVELIAGIIGAEVLAAKPADSCESTPPRAQEEPFGEAGRRGRRDRAVPAIEPSAP